MKNIYHLFYKVSEILFQDVYVRKPNKVLGGVGGIGKSARYFLREIMSDKETFESVFNTDNGKFVIARKGGKKQIKTGLYK